MGVSSVEAIHTGSLAAHMVIESPCASTTSEEGIDTVTVLAAATYEALAFFDGSVYGQEYISLREGERVELVPAPSGEACDEQWCFGHAEVHGTGWFPTKYIKRVAEA